MEGSKGCISKGRTEKVAKAKQGGGRSHRTTRKIRRG